MAAAEMSGGVPWSALQVAVLFSYPYAPNPGPAKCIEITKKEYRTRLPSSSTYQFLMYVVYTSHQRIELTLSQELNADATRRREYAAGLIIRMAWARMVWQGIGLKKERVHRYGPLGFSLWCVECNYMSSWGMMRA